MDRYGHNGKILKVNLTTGATQIEEQPPAFFRKYMGGSLLGAYYLMKEQPAGVDALSPEAVFVLAAGAATGAAVSGVSRFNVTARSPLTGTIGDSQCGGDWGPALKNAGFDAIVVTGRAAAPVYLWLHDGVVEIRDAAEVWGKPTAETRAAVRKELKQPKAEVVCIGQGGEKLVRFACVCGGGSHYAGRTGMGAVMGAKNLKAIAAHGKRPYEFADADAVKALARKGASYFKDPSGFLKTLREFGTPGVVQPQASVGNLATRNHSSGEFDGMESLRGEALKENLVCKSETCFGCAVSCKKLVKAETPYPLDPEYGGPEFETIGMLGSNLLIDDLAAVSRANELCNAYGLDTISVGGIIACLLEAAENGVIPASAAPGIELMFGNADTLLKLILAIGERVDIGAVLADGFPAMREAFGGAVEKYAVHCKGLPFPVHMAHVKMSQALIYAVNPFGADHMSSEHDWLIAGLGDEARALGLDERRDMGDLDDEKVKMVIYTQYYYGLLDSLALCAFCWGPGALYNYHDLEALLKAVCGWDVTMWELMKAGERRTNLLRAFNAREGFKRAQDTLPQRAFEPLKSGVSQGRCVDREAFAAALDSYYGMMGWDMTTGNPSRAKLTELGLAWVHNGD